MTPELRELLDERFGPVAEVERERLTKPRRRKRRQVTEQAKTVPMVRGRQS